MPCFSTLAPCATFHESWTTHPMPPSKLNFNDRRLGLGLPSHRADADPPGYSCRPIKTPYSPTSVCDAASTFQHTKANNGSDLSLNHHASCTQHALHDHMQRLPISACIRLVPRVESRLLNSPSSRESFRAINASPSI
jgi:hypothetical protein